MDWKNHPLLQVEENAEQQGKRPRVVDALCESLTHLLYVNDSAPASATAGDALFAFESSEVPSISIRSYVERWHTYSCCSSACYVICYGWIKRLDLMQRITRRNIHRILLVSLVTACKLVDDIFMNLRVFCLWICKTIKFLRAETSVRNMQKYSLSKAKTLD